MNKKLIVGLVVIVLAVGVYFGFIRKSDNKTVTGTSSSSATSTATKAVAATITYNGSSFSPSTVTVSAGSTIAIVNSSSTEVQFDSDPHPIHTGDPELNIGVVAAGETSNFVVKQKGSFGYHNHLNPSQIGTVVVQ